MYFDEVKDDLNDFGFVEDFVGSEEPVNENEYEAIYIDYNTALCIENINKTIYAYIFTQDKGSKFHRIVEYIDPKPIIEKLGISIENLRY